jgi:predicted transcriptional regulator
MARQVIAGQRVGKLEREILDQLWRASQPLSGRELSSSLPPPERAYTTVMTILSRLMAKGLVEREVVDGTYRYRAAGSVEELTARAIRQLVITAADPAAVMVHFVDAIDDPQLIAELRAALKQVRER